ncbi:pyridoxal phosphate-dependent aminotransferase [Flavobacteriaceae bacterium M23B6Z8]
MIRYADRLNTVEEYYFSKKLREVRGLIAKGKPIINMGIGSPDLPPPPNVIETIQKAVIEEGAHQYQSYQGIPEMRNAMANFYQSNFQVTLDPDAEVLPLMGSKEGIMHISMAFLNEGDEALIPNPGYPTYSSVTRLVGAKTRSYELSARNNWHPDIKKLEKEDLSKVKIMWVNYPHMPTGTNADLNRFEELIAFGAKHHILIVNDNPYSFVLNDKPVSILKATKSHGHVMELNSLSKTFNMAGWRVGMLAGDSEHIKAVLKVKSNMDSGMFYGIQKGATEALKSSAGWYEELNKIYHQRRNYIFELADTLNCTFNEDAVGMFVWAKLPSSVKKSEEFIDKILIEKDVFITPGTIFGSQGEGYIRFSLCLPEERIKEALKRF